MIDADGLLLKIDILPSESCEFSYTEDCPEHHHKYAVVSLPDPVATDIIQKCSLLIERECVASDVCITLCSLDLPQKSFSRIL